LNSLPLSDDAFPVFNHRRKFTLVKAMKLLVEAQLSQRADLEEISHTLRANAELQQAVGLESIRPSQVVRTLDSLPLEVLQRVWLLLTKQMMQMYPEQGVPGLGKLHLIDSTSLSLPDFAGKWAYFSKDTNGVKIHLKLVIADRDTVYPSQVICSTRGVADPAVALDLVIDEDAIHVLDRGYRVYHLYKTWLDQGLRFVARVQKNSRTLILLEREVDENTPVLRDADVLVSYKNAENELVQVRLRLVEFTDEKGRLYRVLTNVWDKTAEQICEMYKHRWFIEIFFKWMKQHVSLVHLYSSREKAVWNQIYLALIGYALVLLLRKEADAAQAPWPFLKLLRCYMSQAWERFLQELRRKPEKFSKGRRKTKRKGRPPTKPKKYTTVKKIVN
jgi:hypothetical protein